MKTVKPVYCIVLVFLLGIICGALGTHLVYKFRMDTIISERGENREERLVNRLEKRLDLDEGQTVQVRAIVHETQEEIRVVRRQFRPQMESAIEKAQRRISAILSPEQQKKYDELIAERKARAGKRWRQ